MPTVDEFVKLEACCGNCTDGTGNGTTVSVEIDPETSDDDELQEVYEAAAVTPRSHLLHGNESCITIMDISVT